MGKTPVTMLSGFLGAGKTTLLRHLLENSKEKIACIVNDVASVNIDAKLVRNDKNRGTGANTTSDLTDTIELQNGCACCNLQDELFASFEQVLALADRRGEPYARIVLENSGVAEPQNIRDKFNEAAGDGHPLMDRIEMDSLVTVVDSSTFLKDWTSKLTLAHRPDLGEGGNLRPVVDLLVEQIECADFVIINKVDLLAKEDDLDQLKAIVASLNPLASIYPCQNGAVEIDKVFGHEAKAVVAKLNIEGQHRGAVTAARAIQVAEARKDKAHSHDHAHGHAHSDHHSHGPDHGDHHAHSHDHGDGHDHSHDHKHGDSDCKACVAGDVHHTHNHEDHAHHDDCKACEGGHSHGHDHDHKHGHDHDHKHAPKQNDETRAAQRFGIRSFVYCRRKPFHPERLKNMVLRWLPVMHNKALGDAAPEMGDSPIKTVMRSKGFMWMASSHATAYYWSHAGQHFEIRDEGDWWAAVEKDEWPEDPVQRNIIMQDFDQTSVYGDRRQEIVFIGVGMDEALISSQLDGALLTEEEITKYNARWNVSPAAEPSTAS